MHEARLPDHDQVQREVDELALSVEAAELHGSLCGLLASGGAVQRSDWLRVLALDAAPQTPAPDSALDRLYLASVEQIGDPNFGFELLLPDDEQELPRRTEALLAWCRGFLGGFGLGAGAEPPLSAESQEALKDLAGIAATEISYEDEEVDESALSEIEEFVRVATLLLYSDCNREPSASRSLH